ncbi:MAG: UvrD-helicase domain-containing protein [Nitrosomonas sp.]|nr:UvrD-helicase domain-containing protein [Nitrosomonas sp.]
MNNLDQIPDAEERLRALDPATSFIVQAPAGSGKTGLLIQRYLRLLTCVDNPEEIIAITFTRKAAAEMRERILTALQTVETKSTELLNESNPFQRLTFELANAALRRDQQCGWQILENPARLRIQTIDSLCASFTQQMPVMSKFGSQPETVEDALQLYNQAALATIDLLNGDELVAKDIEHLFEYLGNDTDRIVRLLVEMLARRDHWLRHIHGNAAREELEESLENVRRTAVDHISALFPPVLKTELLALVCYAAANLMAEKSSSMITQCDVLEDIPYSVEQWCGIAELLLTTDGSWRKRVTRNQGFPPGKTVAERETAKAWKMRIGDFIEQLGDQHELRQVLHAMRQMPPPAYDDNQWKMLEVLTRVLPRAAAELNLVFHLNRQVDFVEVSQRALLALGDSEMPTDLVLTLDYKIRHLLIDEFQDTSISQFLMIEKLTAGWEAGDGRSLFAVGDPMQSIYRFREAEVGLFLQARQSGIGHITLESITLSSNFRSQLGIVNWVNQTFQQFMPVFEDVAVGAVAYTPSFAAHQEHDERAVTIHPILGNDRNLEAQMVMDVIAHTRNKDPGGSIAILVRNRSHLSAIIEYLKANQVCFHAVDIESLNQKPLIQDLLMLARALQNPADSLAWLSVLRAPWCGLTLNDLQALILMQTAASDDKGCDRRSLTIWALIQNDSSWSAVSEDGATRLRRVRKVLEQCMQNRYRKTMRTSVESVWQALGGPACVINDGNESAFSEMIDDAEKFFEYLEQCESAGKILNWTDFEDGLAKLYASADLQSDGSLQIMTIHKSKGLEFDTVLLPGLGNSPRMKSRQLLQWMELPCHRGNDAVKDLYDSGRETDLFLAPIQETGKTVDKINQWMALFEQDKENYESDRLLYVAVTRARKYLHLLGHVNLHGKSGETELKKPKIGCLLNRLWPVVEQKYVSALKKTDFQPNRVGDAGDNGCRFDQTLKRLPSNWQIPDAPKPVFWISKVENAVPQEEIEYSWAGEIARHIGSVVHRTLQQMADDELNGWDIERIYSMRNVFIKGLQASGFEATHVMLEKSIDRINSALINTLTDERGRWLLSKQHEARNEFRLTGIMNHKVVNYVIDRTFCDLNNHRWIIDYKTSSHEGAGREIFLDRELKRYHNQLSSYAEIFRKMDKRKIFLGLYFPLLSGWREWEHK